MKFNADQNFIYITTHANEHKNKLHSHYKMTKEDLEQMTKDWSTNLLIPTDLAKMSDIENPETTHDTTGPSKTKNTKESKDVSSTSVKTASISPERGGDGEETSKKRKVSPLKPSSRKKSKASMTKL
jgi:hypothetical protein